MVLFIRAPVAAEAQASRAVPGRGDRRVIFTAEQTRVLKPPTWCGGDERVDKTGAWTPSRREVDAFERQLEDSLRVPELQHITKAVLRRQYRQHFGIRCGGERRIFAIVIDAGVNEIVEEERGSRRQAGYSGPLWRVLPWEYWNDLPMIFALYDPLRHRHVRAFEIPFAHRVRPPVQEQRPRAEPGSTCVALGFGPWTGKWSSGGEKWLPPGWDERFPHLELRGPNGRGGHGLALAPHSPRPAVPVLQAWRAHGRFALVFDHWAPRQGNAVAFVRRIALGMGLFVEGTWQGDTLRARARTGGDNVILDAHGEREWDAEADAFAVRYLCNDPRAAEAADQAMERLRRGGGETSSASPFSSAERVPDETGRTVSMRAAGRRRFVIPRPATLSRSRPSVS